MPRQKWRGISIFGMTNPFEPPKKQALDDAELALAIEGAADPLAAMELLETQAKLRAEDAKAYVAWVRQMESTGTDESRRALNIARRVQAGLPAEAEEQLPVEVDELAWQKHIPDWQERQQAQQAEIENAVAQAKIDTEARFAAEREAAVAAAIAEAEAEDERLRSEAAAELVEHEVEQVIEVEEIAEPQPLAAADYATGSFDIIESAEQSADDSDEDFDFLLTDGELPFAREPKSGAIDKPLSTITRRSKSISQLFIWGGLTVGIAPLALAAYVSHLPNVGDGIIAIAIGLIFSSAIISIAAIAGKRSGLSTLVLARAAFGVHGNLVSAIPLVLIKILFGAGLLYAAVNFFDGSIIGMPSLNLPLIQTNSAITWQVVGLAGVLLIGGLIAFFGGRVLYWAQVSVAAFGAIATLVFVAVTIVDIKPERLSFSASPDFWGLVGVSSLVGIFFGAFWATAVAEFARKIPMRESGKKVSLFVALATGVIPLLIASYALLALRSNLSTQQIRVFASPILEVLGVLPDWAANIVLYSAILTVIIWAASWMYATSVSFAAIGIKLRPALSQPIILLLSLGLATYLSTYLNFEFLAVIVLAWAGIFVGDVTLRRIAYHEVSLVRDYGFYRAWNWVNLVGFFVAIAVGLGFSETTSGIWSWLGYISHSYSNVGIYIATVIAFAFPVLFGRKRVRVQESEVLKIESRRHDLVDVAAE